MKHTCRRRWSLGFAPFLLAVALLNGCASANLDMGADPHLGDPMLSETSGLAASHTTPGAYWMINDSGNAPVLYKLSASGDPLGRWPVRGVRNVDWEDLDSFVLNGKPYILIADTGDNRSRRRSVALFIVPEPSPSSTEAVPERAIVFQYPGGPRDCEAVAVDAAGGRILLVSKRTKPPLLYELPLAPARQAGPLTARLCGPVNIPPASFWLGPYGRMPTAMAISPDGRLAALLTYERVLIYPRKPGEDWSTAFARSPLRLHRHGLQQAEGMAFSTDGRKLLVVSEGTNTPIVTYDVPSH